MKEQKLERREGVQRSTPRAASGILALKRGFNIISARMSCLVNSFLILFKIIVLLEQRIEKRSHLHARCTR